MQKSKALLLIAGFYFCYFAFNGLFSPYWGLYLAELSFPAWQIGILTSLTQINRIYAPALWGWLADRSGQRQKILRLAGVMGLIFFLPLLLTHSFWPLLISVWIASFFWSSALPLVEATSMTLLAGNSGAYARLRVWGSIGFVVAALLAGYLIDAFGVGVLPMAVVSVMAGLAIYSFYVPEAPVVLKNQLANVKFFDVLAKTEVRALLLACFLMALAHGAYYSFYSIYMVEHGYSKRVVAWLWTLGVIAEIAVFWLMPSITQRFTLKKIFLCGLMLAVVRFMLIGLAADFIVLLIVAQLAHGFTFGSHHAVTMSYIHRHFYGAHQAKGQALNIAVSFGLGGSLGGILAGLLWTEGGAMVFMLSAGMALLGLGVAWLGINKNDL
ncbi:MFS transporter [uncultured Deefgea sp.]|uniref:MFS transporter n=1 Tax=uncultured Deefgea sp. TaxID=1304914 RepID=UPI00260608BF|nr:MFS transporter [uncultured Deefgea sp.]